MSPRKVYSRPLDVGRLLLPWHIIHLAFCNFGRLASAKPDSRFKCLHVCICICAWRTHSSWIQIEDQIPMFTLDISSAVYVHRCKLIIVKIILDLLVFCIAVVYQVKYKEYDRNRTDSKRSIFYKNSGSLIALTRFMSLNLESWFLELDALLLFRR